MLPNLCNKVPHPSTGLCPDDLFTKTRREQRQFHVLHVWGCPLCVLDKTITNGKKHQNWKSRSSQGIFMGLSPDHASPVPLVLKLDTAAITPQFHVVFDDWFTTVTSSVDDVPDFNSSAWSKMFGDSEYQFTRDEDDTQVDPEDFMTSGAITTSKNRVSKAMDTTMSPTPLAVSPTPSSPSNPSLPPSPVPSYPRLPALLPLLCLPHQLVHQLQLSARRRNSRPEDTLSPQQPQQRDPSSPTLQRSHRTCKQSSMLNMDPTKKSYASIAASDLTEDTSLLNFITFSSLNLESLIFKLARQPSQTQITSLMIKFSCIQTFLNRRKAPTRKSHNWKAKTHGLKFQLQKPLPTCFQAHGYFIVRELQQESSPISRQDSVSEVTYKNIYQKPMPQCFLELNQACTCLHPYPKLASHLCGLQQCLCPS